MNITFSDDIGFNSDTLVLCITLGGQLTNYANKIDIITKGALRKSILNSNFIGDTGQVLLINSPYGLKYNRIIILGIGDIDLLARQDFELLGFKLISMILPTPDISLNIVFDRVNTGSDSIAQMSFGILLGSWNFNKYKTNRDEKKISCLLRVNFFCKEPSVVLDNFKHYQAVASGIFFARNLVSEPSNIIYPESFVDKLLELKDLGVQVEILDESDLLNLGFGALLCVGQGSSRGSYLAIMKWNGGKIGDLPLSFVGKGVCFDTGGISIKPSYNMGDMKFDMAGAGSVAGLIKSLALRKAKVNIVGVLGLVENMPSGSAVKPGDVVTSLSGQTIEVVNTDAEGRLVLADALWYTQDRFNPLVMIDMATLTGAIIVSLGTIYAGIFTNNINIANQLCDAGEKTGEKVWNLPLTYEYNKQISSPIADISNIGNSGRDAGSITAAAFLKHFTNGTPWVHIDIAGVAWSFKNSFCEYSGATGFGIKLLDAWIYNNYEK